ncbi:unnamed protein product [Didymodactylos carnosus]|uniref:ADP-ribosylhydrolase ARH3 n=1 Tax=Didymodactylos carnosus TaxID=1234261 RepID=A0A8S2DYX0_9BILA|nr:unnamed protein product [Didymodactylos carnosus]CAF3805497.1 unnamed protein product [Didymodactylos carnosus]
MSTISSNKQATPANVNVDDDAGSDITAGRIDLHELPMETNESVMFQHENTQQKDNSYPNKTLTKNTEDSQLKHDDNTIVNIDSINNRSPNHLEVPHTPDEQSPNKRSKQSANSRSTSPAETPSSSRSPSAGWLNPQRNMSSGKIVQPDQLDLQYPNHDYTENDTYKRIAGSMMGMAIGDALGAHVEFRPRSYLEKYPVENLQGGGTWGLEAGQWTDDTSMALCLAISLILKGDHDAYDQLVRYKWWWKRGYMSSTGQCFDIGNATSESLQNFISKQKAFGKTHKISYEQMDSLSAENSELFANEQSTSCSRVSFSA